MIEQRKRVSPLLVIALWVLLLGTVVAPIFSPASRQAYAALAERRLGGPMGGMLAWLVILFSATLVAHIQWRQYRPLTTSILVSLLLHMLLVLSLHTLGFSEKVFDEVKAEGKREIAFGLPSPVESAASESVRDNTLDLRPADTQPLEKKAVPKEPPSDAAATKPDMPSPARLEKLEKSLVELSSASKPAQQVEDKIQPKAPETADLSKPQVAKMQPIERPDAKLAQRTDRATLEAAKMTAAEVKPAEASAAVPKPSAQELAREALRQTPAAQRLAQVTPKVSDEIRASATVQKAQDAIHVWGPMAGISPPETPSKAVVEATQMGVSKAAGGPSDVANPKLAARVQLNVNAAQPSSLAGAGAAASAEPRLTASAADQPDLAKSTAVRQESLRLPSRATTLAAAPGTEEGTFSAPEGRIRGVGRVASAGTDSAAAGQRPSARLVSATLADQRGSLAAGGPQPVRLGATAGAQVSAEIGRRSPARETGAPLRGVGASAATIASASEAGNASPGGGAAGAGRAFELEFARGEAPTAPGKLTRAAQKIFSGGTSGGARSQETLAESEIGGVSGRTGGGTPAVREQLPAAAGTAAREVYAIPAPVSGVAAATAASAAGGGGGGGAAPAGRGGLAPGRSGGASTSDAGMGGAPAAPIRTGTFEGKPGSLTAYVASLFAPRPSETVSSEGGIEKGGGVRADSAGVEGARIVPGSVRAAAVGGGGTGEGGSSARRAGAAAAGLSVAKAQTGDYAPAVRGPAGGGGVPGGGADITSTRGGKLVAAPAGVAGAAPVASDYEPGSAAFAPVGGGKGQMDTLSFSARTAAAGEPGRETAGAAPTTGVRGGKAVQLAKATGGDAGGGDAGVSLPSARLREGGQAAERPHSRLTGLFAGITGLGKVNVPDELPRGERASAYRSVAAAEMMTTPKLQRQKLIYSLRSPEKRRELISELGGSAETEKGVESALAWLAKAQSDDGRWSVGAFKTAGQCGGVGDRTDGDVGVTGLALLSYLGAGYTHIRGDHRDTIRKALDWLIAGQRENGDLRRGGQLYSQAMATAALCESYSLTDDARLREPAQRAVQFICASQNPHAGWRYMPREDSDTSVTGWQVLALKSAEIAGIQVPAAHFEWTAEWLEKVRRGQQGGLYAYKEGHGPTPVMSAEGWFCQLFMGQEMRTRGEGESVKYLMDNLPVWDPKTRGVIHFYYWYYATLALHLSGGEAFDTWNKALREALLKGQRTDGAAAGSWDPADQLGERGGRMYSTTMATLCLEVYYRYLPFYRKTGP